MSALGANRTCRDGGKDVNDPNLREHSRDLPIGLIPILRLSDLRLPNRGGRWT